MVSLITRNSMTFEDCFSVIHQVALERVKEYTDLIREPPEFVDPRPPATWPEHGVIKVENLAIRYAVSSRSSHKLQII